MSDSITLPTLEELNAFEETLFHEASEQFKNLIQAHENDVFYGIYIYTTPEIRYISVGGFIEDDDGESGESIDWYLRWSPCDSPLHEEGKFLDNSEAKIWWYLGDNQDIDLTDDEFDTIIDMHIQSILKVMKKLDAEKVFTTKNASRENIVLNILMGDQSDEQRIEFARELNPKEVADVYESELKKGNAN